MRWPSGRIRRWKLTASRDCPQPSTDPVLPSARVPRGISTRWPSRLHIGMFTTASTGPAKSARISVRMTASAIAPSSITSTCGP